MANTRVIICDQLNSTISIHHNHGRRVNRYQWTLRRHLMLRHLVGQKNRQVRTGNLVWIDTY